MPKLALAVAAASHRILAAKASAGNGSDAPDFDPCCTSRGGGHGSRRPWPTRGTTRRPTTASPRLDMNVRSVIPAKIGRRSAGRADRPLPAADEAALRPQGDKRLYGQRSQSETVNSMMKRNLGEYLRSVRTRRRKQEMLFKSLVHNLMLGPRSGKVETEPDRPQESGQCRRGLPLGNKTSSPRLPCSRRP